MKENKYDDPVFFQKYSEMNRSKYGLQGAGEWQEFQKMMPDFTDKEVLDLGCGYRRSGIPRPFFRYCPQFPGFSLRKRLSCPCREDQQMAETGWNLSFFCGTSRIYRIRFPGLVL